MVAAAQESKRLGLCQKSMFVVPNHLVGQWASEYLRLYPSANILVTTKQDFETGNRKKFCGRIATGDYDAVIIGHSQFEKIPMSVERQKMQLEQQLFDIERGIEDVQASNGEQFTVKQLMKTRKGMRELVSALIDASPVPFVPVADLEMPAYYDSEQQSIFIRTGLNEKQLFVSMAKEVSAAVFDFKHNESREASEFKSYCVAYMVSSRYGVDTRGFNFSRLPKELAETDTQAFKGELGSMELYRRACI